MASGSAFNGKLVIQEIQEIQGEVESYLKGGAAAAVSAATARGMAHRPFWSQHYLLTSNDTAIATFTAADILRYLPSVVEV